MQKTQITNTNTFPLYRRKSHQADFWATAQSHRNKSHKADGLVTIHSKYIKKTVNK